MQDDHLGFEIINRLRLRLLIDKNHAFPEIVPLQLLLLDLGLDCETDGLTCTGLFHVHPLVMDTLHLHWVELTLLIGSEK